MSNLDHQAARRWHRLAWTYVNDDLRLVLSSICYTLVAVATLVLIGRSFLASGAPGLLLLECGVVLWSLAGTVGDLVDHGDANVNVTIFNTGILLAGLCHLAGAALSRWTVRVLRARPVWLAAAIGLAVGGLALVTHAALAGWLPVFFIPGHGGTPLRYAVLSAAIVTFALTAGLMYAGPRAARVPFTDWYVRAMLLLAVGLFGIMIQLSLWTAVNWLSRTAQWLGGSYLLVAALAAVRAAGGWAMNLTAELAEAREAARLSEERYRLLAAATFEGIAVTDQGRIVDTNDQLLQMLGYARPELLGRAVADLIPAEDRERVLANIRAGSESRLDHAMMRQDGTCLIVEVHGQTVTEHGRTVRYTAVRDITERQRADQALRASHERLDLALRSANMATFDWDIVQNKRVWSAGVHRLLGTNPATFTGTAEEFFQIIHPDDRSTVQAALAKALATDGYATEYRVVWPDGSLRRIAAHGRVQRDPTGQAVQMTGVCWDITARKAAELELQARLAELRQLNSDLARFNKAAIGRELKMVELKEEINALCAAAGQPPRYPLPPGSAPG